MEFLMYILGAMTVAAAGGVVFAQKSLYSALSLIATMFFIAVHFALLGAEFLAAVQVMVYAGAIMVLVVFVIMLLGLDMDNDAHRLRIPSYISAVLAALFASAVGFAIHRAAGGISKLTAVVAEPAHDAASLGNSQTLGRLLFSEYVFAFEVTGVLLLAAIIGAVVLAQDKKRPLAKGRGLSAMHKN